MRVVFLLGAGISRDVLPLSKKLSEIIQRGITSDGKEVVRHTDRTYFLAAPHEAFAIGRPYVQRVISFLAWLKNRFAEEALDYEGLYFACQQIHDALTGELENPLLQPFIVECEQQAIALDARPDDSRSSSQKLAELMTEAMNYIAGVVSGALVRGQGFSSTSGDEVAKAHGCLLGACRDQVVQRLDVVTLNHDTLLESSFKAARIKVEDGFARASKGFQLSGERPARVQFWRGFRRKRRRVRLVKLHGSIDWWRVRPGGADWTDEAMARVNAHPQRLHDGKGVWWDALDARPVILVGTFNKILDYTRPLHLQHYAVMRRALLMSSALVIAGYSFRDKAVNGLIIDWYYSKGARPLVVIGPRLRPDQPPPTARPAIANKWVPWCSSGRMSVRAARFDEVDWESIKPGLVAE
ncbi:MAG TPA: SIR2 family protein [Candidatus Krumholzibacteria bacterium]